MSSLVYQGCIEALLRGEINFAQDRFKVLLVGKDYVPDRNLHRRRTDVAIAHEIDGLGYAPGGFPVAVHVKNNVIMLGGFTVDPSTFTATAAVYYHFASAGWVANLDLLVAYVDFQKEVSSRAGPFTLTASTIRLS